MAYMNIETFIDYDNKLLKCGICGKWFKPLSNNQFNNLVSKAKRLNRIFFCGTDCKRNHLGSKKVICDNCGSEFLLRKSAIKHHNFCNRKCWNEYLKNNSDSIKGEERICSFCQRPYIVSKNSKGKYCSVECQHKDILKHNAEKIEQGYNVSHRILRTYLINKYTKCMNPNCKWDWESDDNPQLELHHIDGIHTNNVLSNCVLLCPNCHSMTDNYKFKNSHKSTRNRKKVL